MLLYLHHHLWLPLRDLALPMFLMIDLYYRVEWFELHTTWGHVLLGSLFGGE